MWEIRVWSLGQEDPWRRKWQPTPVLLSGKFHGWRNLVGYSPWDPKELDITEQLYFHFPMFLVQPQFFWEMPVHAYLRASFLLLLHYSFFFMGGRNFLFFLSHIFLYRNPNGFPVGGTFYLKQSTDKLVAWSLKLFWLMNGGGGWLDRVSLSKTVLVLLQWFSSLVAISIKCNNSLQFSFHLESPLPYRSLLPLAVP